jgi:hypothetical protein
VTNYDELSAMAEAGELQVKPGTTLSEDAAAECGRQALMDATGTATVDEAATIALGRPHLDTAESPAPVTEKARTTAGLGPAANAAAQERGVSVSQLMRDAAASCVRTS